jgi:4-amino-4-deoxy-L-arabinose transferase-like glycosyltransferase
LWAGLGLFILINKVKWLLNWRLYIGVLISLICFLPIVYWNIQNNFITYKFHSERITHHQIQWDSLLREILGEVVYQNPIVFILILISVIHLIKNRKIFSSPVNNWLLCMSLPMILLFWGISLFNPTLPHWSGPAYIPLFYIGAGFLEHRTEEDYPRFIKYAGFLLIGVVIIATAFIRFAPFNIGSQSEENIVLL